MLIDAVTEKLFKKRYDRDGRIAASGQVLDRVIEKLIQAPFFRQTPPKTAGREEFGHAYAQKFLGLCEGTDNRDAVATATALTVKTITDAIRRFVLGKRGNFQEIVVSGGGAKNPTLMAMLRNELAPLGITLRLSDEFGVPTEAKEAVAFAAMAYETWHRRPSNVPSATGAKRPAILGKISYA
jgi:anhydro-N-acetylmuramic acid kinase